MGLKVGMYVRGSYYQYKGKIGEIIKNYQNELEIAYKDGIIKTTVSSFIDDNFDNNGKQYKASYNIIDLIEVGDVITFEGVDECNFPDLLGIQTHLIESNELIDFKDMVENESAKLISIVTKEQFESMQYKVS